MNIELLREYIRGILAEGIYDPGILKAVFMAGGPGSGKSFTAKALFGADPKSISQAMTMSGLKIINSDPLFEKLLKNAGVDPGELGRIAQDDQELAYELGLDDARGIPPESPRARAKASKKLAVKRYSAPGRRLGIILDGTGDDLKKINDKKKDLEEVGYDTYMVFVNTSLEVAQERNADRERKLDPEMVEKIWTDVQSNLGAFQQLFGANNIVIVDNTVYGPVPETITKAVDGFLRRPIQNPIGRKWAES